MKPENINNNTNNTIKIVLEIRYVILFLEKIDNIKDNINIKWKARLIKEKLNTACLI